MIKNIFVNPDEGRLRAGWRIVIFMVSFILASRILSKLFTQIVGSLDKTEPSYWASRAIIVILAGTVITLIVRKFIDKKTFSSLGLKCDRLTIIDFIGGLIISAVMAGLIFSILFLTGHIQVQGIGWSSGLLTGIFDLLLWFFGIGLAVGWSEELAFRGYLLQNMAEGLGLWWSILISCVLYGLLHMANPGSTLLSGSFIALIGFLRIFGWLRSGQLWLSMGMHAGWDFFLGPIFGFTISGMKTQSLIRQTTTGSDLITGGKFGPEAGLLVIPVIAIGLLAIYLWTLKREVISGQ